MDVAAIETIVSHMKGRSLFDILKAMFANHFVELRASRWAVRRDGEFLGRIVLSHDLTVDDVLGTVDETWAWTEQGKARVLHLVGNRDGTLTATLDGKNLEHFNLELRVDDEGQQLRKFLVIELKFAEHTLQFSGLLE